MQPAAATVPGRSCGTCTLCCRLPDIDELDKPANIPCRHCVGERGCTIYQRRPAVCRDFFCLWMTTANLPQDWEPARSHMMIYRQGPQITVLVDPDFGDVWRAEPYATHLRQWAVKAEQANDYIVVFVGDEVFKV